MKTDTLHTPTRRATGHTPGPWYARDGMIVSETAPHGATLATVNTTARQIADDEAEANGCLMAAAPDLLDTLRTIRHHCQSGPVPGRLSREEMAQIVGAAIDRATEGSR